MKEDSWEALFLFYSLFHASTKLIDTFAKTGNDGYTFYCRTYFILPLNERIRKENGRKETCFQKIFRRDFSRDNGMEQTWKEGNHFHFGNEYIERESVRNGKLPQSTSQLKYSESSGTSSQSISDNGKVRQRWNTFTNSRRSPSGFYLFRDLQTEIRINRYRAN